MKKNNKQVGTVILIIIIALLLVGAVVLYNQLSKKPTDIVTASDVVTASDIVTASPTALPAEETQGAQEPEATEAAETEKTAETKKPVETTAATEPPAPTKAAGPTAAEFTMLNLKGKETKLTDFFGKPIVLNFWASWCGPCRIEMPYFEALYKEMKDEVHFVMVNLTTAFSGPGETPEKAKAFIEENGYSFPVYLDVHQQGAINYAVVSIPQTYFINKDGEVVTKKIGVISQEELKANIDKLLE